MSDQSSSDTLGRRDFLATCLVSCAAGGAIAVANPTSELVGAEKSVAQPIEPFAPVKIPDWVRGVTRMTFATLGDVDRAADAGAQVVHGNLVWPYYPLRRDGGGLMKQDTLALRAFVDACHRRGMKLSLGLPPFPPVSLMREHRDWRVHPDNSDKILTVEPKDDDLGTRLCCNLGPWGDYLIEVCAELIEDCGVDGYSFDGNYHAPLCFCPACKAAYRQDRGRELPAKIDLDDVAYREYLQWRGQRLEQHYAALQKRLKGINPDAVVMSWTVNAGRYGHLLFSPRSMTTRMNLLFDLPMQEWWHDETNFGGSVAGAFGAAYLSATVGGRPNASEPYMMSRGNPYGTDSFPAHERTTRALLAFANGSVSAESMGWPGHAESTRVVFDEIAKRSAFVKATEPVTWAALLVSEQTRQFYAHKDIAKIYLPHVFGAFRCGLEEHLPVQLINDWDLTPAELAKYQVLLLPGAAAMSNAQVDAVRDFVKKGGGLIASGETSLCDELGRPRADFALADLFGVSYSGRPKTPSVRPELDANFRLNVDERYWQQRVGAATLAFGDHEIFNDPALQKLVPTKSVTFRGPLTLVSEPRDGATVIAQMTTEGDTKKLSAIVARRHGLGNVIYCAAALDAALWSYGYPYQRRLLALAMLGAAKLPPPVSIAAPMCVQVTMLKSLESQPRRLVLHFFNGMNTTANHGDPSVDVPLREEVVPIHGVSVVFPAKGVPRKFHVEPGNLAPAVVTQGDVVRVTLPPLEIHSLLVAEY